MSTRALLAVSGLFLFVSLCIAASAAAQAPAGDGERDRNLLTLAEGAVVLAATANAPAALSLTDGAPATSWNSGGPRNLPPFTFVFELRGPTRLARVGLVNAGARPGGVAGASARRVRIEASSESPERGFVALGILDAAEDGATMLAVTLDRPVRWLRYSVETSHAATRFTYWSDAVAVGTQDIPADANRFTGVFQVERSAYVELRQNGTSISGCYVEQNGRITGTLMGDVSEGVARLVWRSAQNISGPALLVVDSRGNLNGVRFRDRSRGAWGGPKAPAGTRTPCSTQQAPANPIAAALASDGTARLYGILFDFDQATLRAESEPALRQLLAALEATPALAVTIEGHTDARGADAYNQTLSERRAQAVVAWLTQRGIAAARLTPAGRGESQPVASNDTADGRALNRRVEVVRR